MLQKVALISIVLTDVLNVVDAVIANTIFEKNRLFDGKIDDTNVLRTTQDISLMRCATSCDKDPNCVAFYNNPTTRTCQEQRALSNADMIGLKFSPGFRYYQDCSHKVAVTPTAKLECPVNNGAWSTGHLPDGTYLFKLFTDMNVNYATAFNICKGIGANLPKIYEVDKMQFYLQHIYTCPGIHGLWFWVDGTNLNAPVKTSSDAWTTHDGIVIPKIPELWYQDRPNFPNTEHCIQSRFLSFYYKFDDAGCSTARHQVLCEKKISC